jgi:hypothetical protein
MKAKRLELDVDFIGGQEPLTKEEEVALSEYIQSRRLTNVRMGTSKVSRRKKELELV